MCEIDNGDRVPVPQCTCTGAYEWAGYKVTTRVKSGNSGTRPTLVNDDKETCSFCGYYVVWRPDNWQPYPKIDPKPRFDDIEYTLQLDRKL